MRTRCNVAHCVLREVFVDMLGFYKPVLSMAAVSLWRSPCLPLVDDLVLMIFGGVACLAHLPV